MNNSDIARAFDEIADLLEMLEENPFRIRAYRRAARTMETMGTSAAKLATESPKQLEKLPGFGKDLAGKLIELTTRGELSMRAELVAKIPPSVVLLMRLPGIGPKRARQIYQELGISTVDQLEEAARSGRLLSMRGMGDTLQERILKGCSDFKSSSQRFRLAEAELQIAPLIAELRELSDVEALEVAGSYRRRCESVGDVDILVAAKSVDAKSVERIAERFTTHDDVKEVLARGDTKCAVKLRSGLQVDLRIVPRASWGAALHYFTGSKAHNIAIRTLGVKRQLKISEYGVFRGEERLGGESEEEVFAAVGLPWIPPELREDRGEIEAARLRQLPTLVTHADIRGDLQMHSRYTDGMHSIAEMAAAARQKGYEYIAITDHTQAVRVAGGMGAEGFRRQGAEIDDIQSRLPDVAILKSAEVDILEDGRLDLDDETLASLDLVLVAIHSKLNMSEQAMTERILRGLAHPRVHVLAHPTGRILGRREPYPVDMMKVARAAADRGVLLEIDAQPDRLDLCDAHIRVAKEAGAKLVIDTDAHRVAELDFMRYGVDQARRGWCTAADVANTLPLAELRDRLKRSEQARGRC